MGLESESTRAPAPARRARRSSAGGSPLPVGMHPGGMPASSCAPAARRRRLEPPPCCSATRWGCARPRSKRPRRGSWSCHGSSRSSDARRGADLATPPSTAPMGSSAQGSTPGRSTSRSRVASLPQWQPRLAHPLGDRGTDRRDGGHRLVAGADSSPLVVLDRCNPADQDSLDSAVRAAALSAFTWRRPAGARCWSPVSAGGGGRLAAQGVAPGSRSPGRGRGRRRRPRFSACRRPRRSSG
jgi:hypothetical protein